MTGPNLVVRNSNATPLYSNLSVLARIPTVWALVSDIYLAKVWGTFKLDGAETANTRLVQLALSGSSECASEVCFTISTLGTTTLVGSGRLQCGIDDNHALGLEASMKE